jgi:putative folate metabolism gamma-glutamate ligase
MKAKAIKTHLIQLNERLEDILNTYISDLKEKTVIAITSKIISLSQGRIIPRNSVSSKYALIQQEADAYLREDQCVYNAHLTLKHNLLIPSAGIDESNGNDMYILYPLSIQMVAQEIWNYLRKMHQIESLGVIITDSHTTPLRKGVTGITLGWCGFDPLYSYVGEPDIYEKPLQLTYVNILDSLGACAVFMMGEGAERTPICIIEDAPRVQFSLVPPSQDQVEMTSITLEDDIYAPILKNVPWIWNKGE